MGSLEGVWKTTGVVTTGANAGTIARPQASVMIFSKGHYSNVNVGGDEPRMASAVAKDPNKLTDAEKLARYEDWNRLTANAGVYDVKGTTLTMRPSVAKNVAVMTTDGPIVQEFRLNGNSLVLISKSAAGQPASERRTTLARVK